MPSWEGRLSPLDRKILALYLFDSEEAQRMNGAPWPSQPVQHEVLIWLAVCSGLLLVLMANAHLVYVAVSSQPDCVAHLRQARADAHGRQVQRGALVMYAAVMRNAGRSMMIIDPDRRSASAAPEIAGTATLRQPTPSAGSQPVGAISPSIPRRASATACWSFSCPVVIVGGLFAIGLGLHPVSGVRRLHGGRPDARHRSL